MKTRMRQIYQDVLDGKVTQAQALELLLQIDRVAEPEDAERGARVDADGTGLVGDGTESHGAATTIFAPRWKPIPADTGALTGKVARRYVVLAGVQWDAGALRQRKPEIEFVSLASEPEDEDAASRFTGHASALFELVKGLLARQPTETLSIQVLIPAEDEFRTLVGLLALLKTANRENPRIVGQVVCVPRGEPVDGLVAKLDASHRCSVYPHIRYENDLPLASQLVALAPREPAIPWREGGVYLITGGSGKLAALLAEEVRKQSARATIVLAGRSKGKAREENRIDAGRNRGGVVYRRADVCNEREVEQLIAYVLAAFGCLNGIIHCAGTVDDAFIVRKPLSGFRQVLEPKVAGLGHLDTLTRSLPLDFFICFSSIAAVTGSVGQADYASANAFMDAFAEERNRQVRSKRRFGHTQSINWPLWMDGGMKIDASLEELLTRGSGKRSISTSEAITAFYQCTSSPEAQLVVTANAADGVARRQTSGEIARQKSGPEIAPRLSAEAVRAGVEARLRSIIGRVVNLHAQEIDPGSALENYGISSIIITRLNQLLEDFPGGLPKTLFYEHRTVRELCAHLCVDYAGESAEWVTERGCHSSSVCEGVETTAGAADFLPARQGADGQAACERGGEREASPVPIAVIGVAGRYPKARNLGEYWGNLAAGADCIAEIPSERWSLEGFYTPDAKAAVESGKSYSKWGGFIDGFSEFDPLFFNISPKEASSIDPQERLFLQICWELLEDAGYTRASIAQAYQKKVGVFVGVTKTGFELYGPRVVGNGHVVHPHTSFSSIANRVSYVLDLQGPSFPVDTMCSSSLTAIHEACQHLRQKDCAMAIAGGVNLYLHPSNYVGLCAQNMLAADGRCKSFGSGGDGFVPGEGVGAVLLKPLDRAIEDHDQIYALIRGSALNHGGRTNGYTVPNPQAQASLIRECMQAAAVRPCTVTYVEAHGTGTELGDPIEMRGLAEAFRASSDSGAGRCAIGSVKSNIGHLEAAAGIAGLTKIILQMRHRKIAPSLHATRLNPNIDWRGADFFVNQELRSWEPPVIDGITHPRRAGLSSFGAGGANAHLIVEEYCRRPNEERAHAKPVGSEATPALVVLSAKDPARLREYASRLLAYVIDAEGGALNGGDSSDFSLEALAYTLQVGREAMEERIGIIAEDTGQLRAALQAYLNGEHVTDRLFRGRARKQEPAAATAFADGDMDGTICTDQKKLATLLEQWTKGLHIDWQALYRGRLPRRIRAPTYPFARDNYWWPRGGSEAADMPRPTSGSRNPQLGVASQATGRHTLVEIAESKCENGEISAAGAASDSIVRLEERGEGIVEIAIQDPATQNEVNERLLEKLKHVFLSINKRTDLKAVLLSGLAEHFLTGAGEHLPTYLSSEVPALLVACPVPVVAVMKGDSTGVGWLLTCTCDLMVCNEASTYGCLQSHTPWRCSKQEFELMRARFGRRYAMDVALQGIPLKGTELRTHGLGMAVLDVAEIDSYSSDLAQRFSRIPRESLCLLKRHLTRELAAVVERGRSAGSALDAPVDVGEDVLNEDAWEVYQRLDEAEAPDRDIGGPKSVVVLSDVVRLESYDNGVAVVRLVDEPNRNTFSEKLIRGITEAFRALSASDSHKVAVMTGYASYFACGGTQGGLLAIQQGIARYSDSPLYECPLQCPIPVIAAMQGHGIGAGWTLGMFCDVTLFSYESVYATRFMELGFTPGFGSTLIFPHKLGNDLAREALLTGREYRGAEIARRIPRSLCQPRESLLSHAMAIACAMAGARKEDLIECKRRSTDRLRNDLETVVRQELAMHDRSFIGNEESRQRIVAGFRHGIRPAEGTGSGTRVSGEQDADSRRDAVRGFLRETLADELHMDVQLVDDDTKFIDMGLDSVTGVLWVRRINRELATDITVTRVYSHPSITDLTQFLWERVPEIALPGKRCAKQAPDAPQVTAFAAVASTIATEEQAQSLEAIAVIGAAGQFPDARNLEEFWCNLVAGKDCISLVPEGRWSIADYYDPDVNAAGRTHSKWMGVLRTAALFDPLFFNIAPRDAELMDPQQRIFLQSCWHCIEDSGYRPSALSGSRCGVFAGCSMNDYAHLGGGAGLNAQGLVGGATSILAARVSYFLNLQGPCLAIDTACSSSLVAIATACENLVMRRCDIALAGGVCVLPGPALHIMASKAGMLSADGRCFTFDQRANGFVPGEGVGVVLLKRLSDAQRDGDRIKGVIRGWGVNHDGKTNGMTAPNQDAQTRLEKEVYDRHGIDVGNIRVIEAHGTGTPLGDPIEVEGLKEAFKGRTTRKNYCALGCIKTNVGHLISAAGIAGFLKLLLSIRNKRIPPTRNFELLNEHVRLDDSPFYINTACRDWTAENGERRQGAVSSFGFSGTNAHLVLEEYAEAPPQGTRTRESQPVLVVLSAKNGERLAAYAERLLEFVSHGSAADLSLLDLAYTLQVGREPMRERLALIANDLNDLQNGLGQFLRKGNGASLYRGHAKRANEPRLGPREESLCMENFVSGKDRAQLARAWVSGLNPQWAQLYADSPRMVDAPLYPFAPEYYWANHEESKDPSAVNRGAQVRTDSDADGVPPRLVKRQSSTDGRLHLAATLRREEFFLRDHKVAGKHVLPAVVYLEMALASARSAVGEENAATGAYQLRNVVWLSPIEIDASPVDVSIFLDPSDESRRAGEFEFRIGCTEGDAPKGKESCRGTVARIQETSHHPSPSLTSLRERHWPGRLDPHECYAAYSEMGIDHGPAHRGIETVYVDGSEALARIGSPRAVTAAADEFLLHPSIFDSAFQASLALVLGKRAVSRALAEEASSRLAQWAPAVPFSVDQINLLSPARDTVWAWLRYSDHKGASDLRKVDIEIYHESGELCAQIRGLATRPLKARADVATENREAECLLFEPGWRELAPGGMGTEPRARERSVFLCGFDPALKSVPALSKAGVVLLESTQGTLADRFEDIATQLLAGIKDLLRGKKTPQLLVQILVPNAGVNGHLDALYGLLRSACLEHPGVVGQLITIADGNLSEHGLQQILRAECHSQSGLIKAEGARRYLRTFKEISAPTYDLETPWKTRGAYLITGGAGALGVIFAREILQHEASVVLAGRSPLGAGQERTLRELSASGGKVEYLRVNVADRGDVVRAVAEIKARYGALNGIIHSAGVIKDGLMLGKSAEDFRSVLAPKVQGTFVLDEATKEENLDFFCTFSSGGAVLGSVGQTDYTCANAFMDSFARYREALVKKGLRTGRTVSINWPLWKDGGMAMAGAIAKLMETRVGMVPMATASGIASFYRVLSLGQPQVLVMEGTRSLLQRTIDRSCGEPGDAESISPAAARAVAQADDLAEVTRRAQASLKEIISGFLKVDAAVLDPGDELSEYGLDSISLTELTLKINEALHLELSPTIFFECTRMDALAAHLAREHPELFARDRSRLRQGREAAAEEAIRNTEKVARAETDGNGLVAAPEPRLVAIVGMSGKFPRARDINEFWRNLCEGKDCITEIPADRWNWQEIYGESFADANHTNVKWGGFMDGVGDFDPQFFGISPREAVLMDPQQRLLMTHMWLALEDAGHSAASLAGTNTGIFMGTAAGSYGSLVAHSDAQIQAFSATGSVASVGPNRMSYFLNVHGPSEAIETACSSSLVAIHRAVSAIRAGECGQAVAGGVNIIITPEGHISFSKAGMLSEDGRCKTFSNRADGYVRGEGVGVLFLKDLDQAIEDHDHIYAVIRSSAENHGGRAHSLTAPNPRAQAELLYTAHKQAGTNPATLGYLEAHGTGTALGDPIEIEGIKAAFRRLCQDLPGVIPPTACCGLGSVKTNIGHLELAAGVASVIKVVLQIANAKLVKSLHCDELNPHIDLEGTPFFVVKQTQEWPRARDDRGNEVPRRAGISSFGFGGTNAHIVVEEYVPAQNATQPREELGEFIIPLSARDNVTLKRAAKQLLEFVAHGQGEDRPPISLKDLAYTLQLGRDEMDERMACVVTTMADLAGKLELFLSDKRQEGELYAGNIREHRTARLFEAEDVTLLVDRWLERSQYGRIAASWASGLRFDWNKLYKQGRGYRLSAPTYPFSYLRYWVGETKGRGEAERVASSDAERVQHGGSSGAQTRPGAYLLPRIALAHMSAATGVEATAAADDRLDQADGVRQRNPAPPQSSPGQRPEAGNEGAPTDSLAVETVQKILRASLAEALYMSPSEIELDKPFFDIGLDSLTGVEWTNSLGKRLGVRLEAASVYDYPDIRQLAAFVHRQRSEGDKSGMARAATAGAADGAIDGATMAGSAAANENGAVGEVAMADLRATLIASLADVLFIDAAGIDIHRPFIDLGLDSLVATEWVRGLGQKFGVRLETTRIYDYPTVHEFSQYLCAELGKRAVGAGFVRRNGADDYRGYYFHSSDCRDAFEGSGEIVTRYAISPEEHICLKEHVVGGEHLFPTDAYLEMLYLAVKSHFAIDSVILEEVSIVRPLVVPEGRRAHVTLVLQRIANDVLRFSIRSSEENNRGNEKLHVKGIVRASAAYRGTLRTPRSGVLENAVEIDVPELYSRLSAEIGPFYRTLQSLSYGDKAALGTVLPATEDSRFLLDPSAVNGALIGAVLNFGSGVHAKTYGPSADVFLPYAIDDLFMTDRVARGVYRCYGELVGLEKDRVDLYFEMLDANFKPLMAGQMRLQRVKLTSGAAAGELEARPTPASLPVVARTTSRTGDIAVIGMSCRFPGCKDVSEFWAALRSGKDCIREVPEGRWCDFTDWYDPRQGRKNASLTKRGGFLEDVDRFDPAFFSISRAEAEIVDPQHRIFLQEAWKAVESAGYSPFSLSGMRCGVYVGCGSGDFSRVLALKAQDRVAQAFSGNATSILAARISYFLNLKGPALAVDTACSSSLTAIHLACESIRSGANVLALAGGISLMLSPYGLILTSQFGMQSPSGRCAAFDASADGTVFSEGCGVLLLKGLEEAARDQDQIIGVIRGSDYNQDGKTNGITAPSSLSQEQLLVGIYEKYGIDPASITLIEAHGTGTPLGDPVELRALANAFRRFTDHKQYCGIGSVKTNIGHAGFAAGVAGAIKALLCLQNRQYVPSLHFARHSPHIDFAATPFYVNTQNGDWTVRQGHRRIAAVSSFGFSGTNAHIVLEEYIGNGRAGGQSRVKLHSSGDDAGGEPVAVLLSARDEQRLLEAATNLAAFLGDPGRHAGIRLDSIAYTLQVGRHHMRERLAIVVRSKRELLEKLGFYVNGRVADDTYTGRVQRHDDGSAYRGAAMRSSEQIEKRVAGGDYSEILPLWVVGVDFRWDGLYGDDKPRRVCLPTYPFAKERCWPESEQPREAVARSEPSVAQVASMPRAVAQEVAATDESSCGVAGRFYIQEWKREGASPQTGARCQEQGAIVVVHSVSDFDLEGSLVELLKEGSAGSRVVRICLGEETRSLGDDVWLCGWHDRHGFERCLADVPGVRAGYFLGEMRVERTFDSSSGIVESTRKNELQLLRLVQHLARCSSRDAMIDLHLIGCENYKLHGSRPNPRGGGIVGLGYSIAQGDHRFSVRNIDVESSDMRDGARRRELARLVASEPPSGRGELTKCVAGRRYRQVFVPLQAMAADRRTGLKKGGVYVLLGGSGVVCRIITRYLLEEYAARVVWIGSRPEADESLAASLKSFGGRQFAGDLAYVRADTNDLDATCNAIKEVKRRYTKISGAIFAAAQFSANRSFQETTEEEFLAVFDIKARGSAVFYQALQHEDLDFLIYFSSGQAYAFSGAARLSAYAAGITFADGFVRSLQATRFPVGIINWGFWKAAIQRVSRSLESVAGLDDRDGFRCFEYYSYLLSQKRMKQVLCMNATSDVEALMDIEREESIAVNE